MAGLYWGDKSTKKIYIGDVRVKKIYIGQSLIYQISSDNTDQLSSSTADVWGVCKIKGSGDYVLACNTTIMKVYDGSTGDLKFTTDTVVPNTIKIDVCPGKEDNVIFQSEQISQSSSGGKIRKLKYTGTGFTEITNADIGSGHGLCYDTLNDRIIGAGYYNGCIRAFSDDNDATEMTNTLNVSTGTYTANVKASSDGKYIYYTKYNSLYLGRYDTSTGTANNSFIKMLPSGSGWAITGFALSDDNKKIIFEHNTAKALKVLDIETGQITATIDDADTYTLRISNIGNNRFLYVAWDKSRVVPKYIIERDLSPYLT